MLPYTPLATDPVSVTMPRQEIRVAIIFLLPGILYERGEVGEKVHARTMDCNCTSDTRPMCW